MNQLLFDTIFKQEIIPFIEEMQNNNSLIDLKDLEKSRTQIFNEYRRLNASYKEAIFEKEVDTELLDRHKIASCICGAFLRVGVFDKRRLFSSVSESRKSLPVYFYYVNEMVAFYAATRYLAIFMINDKKDDLLEVRKIYEKFPLMPQTSQNKRGFWNSVLFNLAQVKNKDQIGLEHYDMYSYAMFFYWIEKYFYIAKEIVT